MKDILAQFAWSGSGSRSLRQKRVQQYFKLNFLKMQLFVVGNKKCHKTHVFAGMRSGWKSNRKFQ